MSPWLIFLTGFLAFPALVALVIYAIHRRSRVKPLPVNDPAALQAILRSLLQQGKNGATLYLMDCATRVLFRVTKSSRTRSNDTLAVEVRRSDANEWYEAVRDSLKKHHVPFEEDLTPKRRHPRRLRIRHDTGGPLAVTFVENAVKMILKALPSHATLDLLASNRDPHFWIASKKDRLTAR